eukprot:3328061-Amphidinium_carterae.2
MVARFMVQFQLTKTLAKTMFIDTTECAICRSMPSIWQSTQGPTLRPMTKIPDPNVLAMLEADNGGQKTLASSTVPTTLAQNPRIKTLLGLTVGIWELNNWGEADNAGATQWLVH